MLILKVFKKTYRRTGRKKDGTDFTVHYQEAEMKRRDKRPKPIEITVSPDNPYVEGMYTIDGESFRPDNYDRLALSPYFKLVPLNDAIKSAQEAENMASK